MTKVGLNRFIFLSFLLLSSAVYGQKVKYKDIFGLLSTKQYETAEPFLKKYLKENDDNPNAFLFMGIIFQEKSGKMDVLKQTPLMIANMDSSIIYYDKAYKTIDEREVRKEKDYYQAYNRRDLRTGEFGVKLSDIQFDIEKKIQGLKERIEKVKMVKHSFVLADTTYKKANILYSSLQKQYPSERQLYLRAEETTIKNLTTLINRFDSCTQAFEQYKITSGELGRTGYNQAVTLVEINDFATNGTTGTDFYQNDIKLWDYKKFALKASYAVSFDRL
jgi:tetratricopeptide (TPR) repeat protein